MAQTWRAGVLAVWLLAASLLAARAGEALGPRGRRLGIIRGKYIDPIPDLRAALRRNPRDPEAHFWLGCHYSRVSEFDKAVQHLEQARELRPEHERTHAELLCAYNELARRSQAREADAFLAKAESAAKALLQLPPTTKESYETLIRLASYKGECFDAVHQPDKEREMRNEALGYCEKALEIDPDDVTIHLERIRTLFALERYRDAERRCNEVLKLNSKLHEPQLTLARIRRIEGDYAAAIRILSQVLEQKHTQIEARLRRAEVYTDIGRYEQALADADEVIRLTSRNPYANFIRGRVYVRTDRLDEAIREFRLAAAGMPKHVPSRLSLARCLFVRGCSSEATDELIDLLALDPSLTTAHRVIANFASHR